MLKDYHTVEVYEDGKWSEQFGDFDLEVAKEELEHLRDYFNTDGTKAKVRIVTEHGYNRIPNLL